MHLQNVKITLPVASTFVSISYARNREDHREQARPTADDKHAADERACVAW